jgi:hypothetical protein
VFTMAARALGHNLLGCGPHGDVAYTLFWAIWSRIRQSDGLGAGSARGGSLHITLP